MASLMFICLTALVSVTALFVVCWRRYYRLHAFKGPLFASISELWLVKVSLESRMHIAQQECLERYGSPTRIGPNLLVTNDPELLRHMSAPKSTWTRGSWYEEFDFGGAPTVFSERDEKGHARLRGKLGPAYSGKGVDNLEPTIVDKVGKMIDLLRREYVNKARPVDMVSLSTFFTLDVLSQIAFGHAFGYLEANEDRYDYIDTMHAFLPILELSANHPFVRRIVRSRLVTALLAPKETDKVGMGPIILFAHQAVAQRYKQAETQKDDQKADMLGSFIRSGLSQREAESEANLQILAGSDSTSTVFRMTMLYVVTIPRVYYALRQEIDAGVRSGAISRVITDFEARRLPYLQAVIWEGLRMTPPLFGLQTKVAPPQGDTVNGVFFPGGTNVATCPAALTHRKDIFGDDANVFRPERWLEADEATHSKYTSTVDLIFGSGRFGCLGRNIGLLELNKVFFELLRHFDWSIVDSARPIAKNYGNGEWIQSGMNMTVTQRQH